MANIRLVKRRIRSAANIAQITKAMELVAAAKMKKAQAQALAGKLYAQKIYSLVIQLAQKTQISLHPLLSRPNVLSGKRLIILISTNKGLCGGLNNNLFRSFWQNYPHLKEADFISLGSKGGEFLSRSGGNLVADFSTHIPFVEVVPALTELITREYLKGKYDGIDLFFNEFISALKQQPKKKTILPLTLEATGETADTKAGEFLLEPSAREVLEALLPHYLENQIRDAVIQADASEHSARMIAMHNATDNADALTQELTLIYNKVRQEKITSEILDIVTARLTVEG